MNATIVLAAQLNRVKMSQHGGRADATVGGLECAVWPTPLPLDCDPRWDRQAPQAGN